MISINSSYSIQFSLCLSVFSCFSRVPLYSSVSFFNLSLYILSCFSYFFLSVLRKTMIAVNLFFCVVIGSFLIISNTLSVFFKKLRFLISHVVFSFVNSRHILRRLFLYAFILLSFKLGRSFLIFLIILSILYFLIYSRDIFFIFVTLLFIRV